jgi:hypothetical protein
VNFSHAGCNLFGGLYSVYGQGGGNVSFLDAKIPCIYFNMG